MAEYSRSNLDSSFGENSVGDCILFSTADWDAPCWTNKQHTGQLLAKQGWRVLYVESPGLRAPSVSSGRDWSRLIRRLKRGLRSLFFGPVKTQEKIHVLSPLMIPLGHASPLIKWINQGLLRYSLKLFMRHYKFSPPLVWAYHPYILESIKGIPLKSLVYHCVDDLSAVPGIDAKAFLAEEIRFLNRCDAVFTTAPALQEKCLQHNPRSYYYSNVVDFDHFSLALEPGKIPADLESIPSPRLVYHGVLSDFKVNFSLLLEVAELHPEWQFVLIGDEREGQSCEGVKALKDRPNVHFLGHRSYHSLPDYLRGMDVGLLPTLLNEYTRSMFPMKFYEYLAAGLPVVSTPLDFTAQSHSHLMLGENAETFSAAIYAQLLHKKLSKDEARMAVGENTWENRMHKMMALAMAPHKAKSGKT